MRFLRFPQLIQFGIPYSRMHVDRLEKAGQFPRRVRLSVNTVVWRADEIEAWIAERVAERDEAPAAA